MLNLKKLRMEQGLSVPKFAELSGTHRRTIEDIEKRGDCMLSTAAKFAKVLNVSLTELYTLDDEAGG